MSTKFAYRIVFVLTIAFFAIMLSACSGDAGQEMVNLYANANSDGSLPATRSTVQFNPRNNCGISEQAQLLARMDADLRDAGTGELSISTDGWLDSQMKDFGCIAPQEK